MGIRELSRTCGVSRTSLSAFETGDRMLAPEEIDRVAANLGVTIAVTVATRTGTAVTGSGGAAHAICIGAVQRVFEAAGLATATEEPITFNGTERWIDLLAFDARIRRLVIVEVKTELRDVGELQRQLRRYELAAIQAAMRHDWRPESVQIMIILLQTTAAEEAVGINRHLLARIAPMRGRTAIGAALAGGESTGWGLVMLDPLRPMRRRLTSTRVDGRRTPAPYADYAAFMRVVEASSRKSGQPSACQP